VVYKNFLVTAIFVSGFLGQSYASQSEPQYGRDFERRELGSAEPSFVQKVSHASLNFCRTYPAIAGLMATNLSVFAAQKYFQLKTKTPAMEMQFGQWNQAIKKGEWWRLVTNIFLNGGLFNLACTTYNLFKLRDLEKDIGSKKLLGSFMASGILAGFAKYKLCNPDIFTIGSNGALAGLQGVIWARAIRRKKTTYGNVIAKEVVPTVLVCAGLPRFGLDTDPIGLIGGWTSGYALGQVFSD
jgi:membrane associated rhomboid family serine protease